MKFQSAQDVKTYTLAGHATITLTSLRTGKHFTFKVSQAKDRETGEPRDGMFFVSLLTGPDNTAWGDYSYMGMLMNGEFRLTKGSKVGDEALSVRGFRYFWNHLQAGDIPADLEVRHEGRCGRCGRVLTVPESVDAGIGPECAAKMGGL